MKLRDFTIRAKICSSCYTILFYENVTRIYDLIKRYYWHLTVYEISRKIHMSFKRKGDNFSHKTITLHYFTSESKRASMEWRRKMLTTVFWYCLLIFSLDVWTSMQNIAATYRPRKVSVSTQKTRLSHPRGKNILRNTWESTL